MIKNLLIVALLFVSTMALAQSVSIDPTFNTLDDGTFGNGGGFSHKVLSTSFQADGKIIVGGRFSSFNGKSEIYCIARLNTNGSLDTTFKTGTGFSNITVIPFVYSTSIQSDGKIIVGGEFISFNDSIGINRITRLNADGSRDTTFNPGTGFNTIVRSTSIQSDGKIIVGGEFTSFNGKSGINRITRLNANGSLDTTFKAGTGFNAPVLSISIQPDGKIIVGGLFTSFNGTSGINRIVRLNTDGTQDATFNTGMGLDSTVRSTSIQPDGKIIVGGAFTSFNGKSGINRIVRLNANGSQDTIFNTGNGFGSDVYSTSTQPDGKIIVGGSFTSFNGTTGINRIARLNANGLRDTTFNTGIGINNPPSWTYTIVESTFIQTDGKIIVGGDFTSFDDDDKKYLIRLNANGKRDASFNPAPGFDFAVHSTSIQADGKIIVGGNFTSFNDIKGINRIVRLNADGSRDTTFKTGTGFNGIVHSIAIQADGKIIVGGEFTSFNGTTEINGIVRLNTDGSRDTSFNTILRLYFYQPGHDVHYSAVRSISIQPDGKIIVGGGFISLNNIVRNIARLNANGTRDSTFNPFYGFEGHVFSTSIQSDGKIIVGWTIYDPFVTTDMSRILRLNANGSRDTTFKASITTSHGVIRSTSILADGKIIVGGSFSVNDGKLISPNTITNLARLNANGTVDTTFKIGNGFNAFSGISSISIQADGKIIVGGSFSSFNGTTGINRIVRLNADGSRDSTFNTGTGFNDAVWSTSIQADGKIIVGGSFNSFNNKTRNKLVRLRASACIASTSSSQNVTVCNTYKWLANGTTYNSSGTYIVTLTNPAGCDSTVTLNLTVKNSTTSSQNIAVCNTYKWLANGTTYNSSGTYTAKITNAAGCDSTVTLNLTINQTPVLTTSVNGATITANETGAAYQWLDCNNANTPITGETNQSFTATANGNYAVIVTKNTCSDTSACVAITTVGVTKIEGLRSNFEVFPNPNNGTFSLQTNYAELGKISITNALGELVFSELIKAQKAEINLSAFGSGVYFIEVTTNGFIGRQKVVIGK